MDKSTGAQVQPPVKLNQTMLEWLYAGDDMARRIVEQLVVDSLREGVTLEGDGDGLVASEAGRLDAWGLFQDSGIWGRLHGGGFLLLGVEGKQDAALDLETIGPGDLKWIMDLDRWAVIPASYYSDASSEKFGEPEIYTITIPTAGAAAEGFTSRPVHESRLIRFPGINTSRRRRASMQSFDDSALVPIFDVLRDANTVWRSGVAAAQDLSQAVFKIKDLVEMLAEGRQEAVLKRMEITNLARSTSRAVVIDAEMEDFSTVEAAGMGSFPGVVNKTWERLAAAACMPQTVLFGMSPSGLNATGESDIRIWYDQVAMFQEDVLLPRLYVLVEVLARSAGVDPSTVVPSFPALWQRSDKEEADLRKVVADTDKVYIDSGVVLPEEVGVSRFGADGWTMEMTAYEPDLREALAEMEREKLEEKASNPDPVPPVMPTPGDQPPAPDEEPPPEEEDEEA